ALILRPTGDDHDLVDPARDVVELADLRVHRVVLGLVVESLPALVGRQAGLLEALGFGQKVDPVRCIRERAVDIHDDTGCHDTIQKMKMPISVRVETTPVMARMAMARKMLSNALTTLPSITGHPRLCRGSRPHGRGPGARR